MVAALQYEVPAPVIGEAVFASFSSLSASDGVEAREVLPGPNGKYEGDAKEFVEDIGKVQ